MIDTVIGFLREVAAWLGILTPIDPGLTGSLAALTVVLVAVAVLAVTAIALAAPARPRGARGHPTRRAELVAPLTQSDPDAAGHILRRGPGRAAPAA